MRGVLIGRIFPERAAFTVGEPFKSVAEIEGGSVSALVDIKASIVSVTMLDEIQPEQLATYRNQIQAGLRKVVNFASLETSAFHIVLLESFVDSKTGHLSILANSEPVDDEQQDERRQCEFDHSVINVPAVAQALESYNKALMEHDFTAKYSLEAIECVREHWGKDQWDQMREALNLRKETLTRHNEAATSQKHGRNLVQTWPQRKDQLTIARETIRRLIAYVRTGAALSKDVFPDF